MKRSLTLFIILFFALFNSNAQTDSRGVGLPKKPDMTAFAGNTYAVIVGISDYKFIKPLAFADKDAILFANFCNQKPVVASKMKIYFLN